MGEMIKNTHCVKCGKKLAEYDVVIYSKNHDIAHSICPQDIKYCTKGHRLVPWILYGTPAPPCKCHPDHHL